MSEIDGSGIAARHSRVTSSTMLRIRKRRPLANWSWKNPAGSRPGFDQDRRPGADRTAPCTTLAHGKTFLPIELIDTDEPGRLAFLAQQDEQPAVRRPCSVAGASNTGPSCDRR